MKRLITILLVFAMALGLIACSQETTNDIMKDVPAKAVEVLPDMDAGGIAAAEFGVRLFQNSFEEGKNTLISPLSVLYALAMTANGADGETLEQMEGVLGMDCDNLNSFMLSYLDLLPEAEAYKLNLANSIWFKDDPNFEVQQTFLQTNADYYGAGAYKAPFDEGTRNDINNWVKEHTDGMIPEIIDQIPNEAIMYLVNALAFEAEWEEAYKEHQVWEEEFTMEDGTRQNAEMMYSEEYNYLEDDLATGFMKFYKDRRYAFVAMLPNVGVSVSQYVSSLTGEHLQNLLNNPHYVSVHTTNPELRAKMLKNKRASEIMDNLKWLEKNDIPIHTQVVLCPNYNDGEELKRTLNDLFKFKNIVMPILGVISSLFMVFAAFYAHGITKYQAAAAAGEFSFPVLFYLIIFAVIISCSFSNKSN